MTARARKCAHCGAKATETWDLRPCAAGRSRRFDLCGPCDLTLNAVVLAFLNVPNRAVMLADYAERKAA